MIDLETARRLTGAALRSIERHRRRINALNVYPVPDGDTGTNLEMTMQGIVAELERSTAATSAQLAVDVQRAATMEAKGNSGVILSTIVRGMARVLGEHERVDGAVLADAMRVGRDERVPGGQGSRGGDDADGDPRDGRGGRAAGGACAPGRRGSRPGRRPRRGRRRTDARDARQAPRSRCRRCWAARDFSSSCAASSTS